MTEMIRKNTLAPRNDNKNGVDAQNLDKVYQGMRELEYSPTKIKEFSHSFSKPGLVAVHLSSCDRWEKLRMRISCSFASGEQGQVPLPLQPQCFPNTAFLEEISILDLKTAVGTCYPGRVLCGTFCVVPFTSVIVRQSGRSATVVNSLLQDKFGRVIRVMINIGTADTFLNSVLVAISTAMYPKGSAIRIESPVLKRCVWDKGLVLYVDNPTTIEVVASVQVPSTLSSQTAADSPPYQAEKKLKEAVALFNSSDWFKAVELYTQCIDECWQLLENYNQSRMKLTDKRSPTLESEQAQVEEYLLLAYFGRCASWLQMKNYKRALSDANKVLQMEPYHVGQSMKGCISQVLFMKGSALFALERYQEASNAFNAALRLNPDDNSVSGALNRSNMCDDLESILPNFEAIELTADGSAVVPEFQCAYKQFNFGEYDLSEYFLSEATVPPPIHASHIGPVEVRSSREAGRGLFLKEPVVAGQLLLVSEALAVVHRNPKRVKSYESILPIIGEDMESEARLRLALDIQEELVTQLAMKMLSSKRLVPQVYSLSDGRSDQSKMIPDMKTFLQGFDDSVGREEDELWDDDDISITILRGIVSENAICDNELDGERPTTRRWGIWVLPSFINHSCHPNSHRMRIGEFMIIRASRDLRAGTEITLPYFNILQFVDGRQKECLNFGFICRCSRCLFEQNLQRCFSTLQKKVQELLELTLTEEDDLDSECEKPPSLLQMARLVETMERSMFSYNVPEEKKNWLRVSLIDPYLACTRLSKKELQELHPANPAVSRVNRMTLLVNAITAVNAGHRLGRRFSAHLVHEVGHEFGWESKEHLKQEVKAMKTFRTYYGISDTDILRQLIAKVRIEP